MLTESIGSVAKALPRRAAVTDARGTTSYGDLVGLAAAYASRFARTPEGACIAALCDPSAQFIAAYLAAMATSRTLVPLNERLPDRELGALLNEARCSLIACQTSSLGRAARLAQMCASLGEPYLLDAERPQDPQGLASIDSAALRDRVACFRTGNATGEPCGALLTHGNLAATVGALLRHAPFDETDVFAAAAPLWRAYGIIVGCLLPLTAGARVVLCPALSTECVAGYIERHRPTVLVAPSTVLVRLVGASWPAEVSSLRFALSSGDPLPPDALDRFEAQSGALAVESYGLTEASAVTACNPFGAGRRPGTVGPPLPNQTVRIVDDHMAPVPVGDVGEIIIRGPNVMAGYLGRPLDTLSVLREGWLHTGDLARMDTEGYLQVVGRKRDRILVDGLSVYPLRVEAVLRKLPGVLDACVIGVRDPEQGAVPKAVIVVADGPQVTDERIRAHCAEYLAEYEVPRYIARVPRLPRTTAGRLSRATVAHIHGRAP